MLQGLPIRDLGPSYVIVPPLCIVKILDTCSDVVIRLMMATSAKQKAVNTPQPEKRQNLHLSGFICFMNKDMNRENHSKRVIV